MQSVKEIHGHLTNTCVFFFSVSTFSILKCFDVTKHGLANLCSDNFMQRFDLLNLYLTWFLGGYLVG